MRDQVSWGFYIGNFAFLVGVAAAAVVLVVPAYVYNWGPIREVVLIAELLSVAAIIMCILFVTVDIGRPQFVWHLMPGVGTPNFPFSMLIWDILVLNAYFLINYFIVTYLIVQGVHGPEVQRGPFIMPVIFLSIPAGDRHPHRDGDALHGPQDPRLLAHGDPRAALHLERLLLGPGVAAADLPGAAARREAVDHGHGALQDRRAAGLRHGGEPLLPGRRGLHRVLRADRARGPRPLPVVRNSRTREDIAVYSWLALTCNSIAFVGFMVPALSPQACCSMIAAACSRSAGSSSRREWACCFPGMTPDASGRGLRLQPEPERNRHDSRCSVSGEWARCSSP